MPGIAMIQNRLGRLASLLMIIMLAFSWAVVTAPLASSHSGHVMSALASVTPTIDGVMSAGEWDDADCETDTVTTSGSTTSAIDICAKNDTVNLYIVVKITNQLFDNVDPGFDFINLNFDNDHDGIWEQGEDRWAKRGMDTFSGDAFVEAGEGIFFDVNSGGTDELTSAVTHSNPTPLGVGDYIVEYSHPLDSADDAHDMSVAPGDTVGLQLVMASVARGFHWPAILAHSWADIIIAPASVDTDADGIPDAEDPDDDNDGIPDSDDPAPADPDQDDDGIVDGSDPDLIGDAVLGLDDAAFDSHGPGHRNAMLSILDNIEGLIATGNTANALQKLENLRRHVDGCVVTSGSADNNDWIVDCEAQLEIRTLIDQLISNLNA